ncbi:MAG: cupin domain-containing protein [Rickettsiaceae bacterium]|nr:cupin domain-containing protein [Rickettsiaceae bacterium]
MKETKNDIAMLQELYGVRYYHTSSSAIHEASKDQTYYFKTFIGRAENIQVESGDCIYYLSDDLQFGILKRGQCNINSLHCATIIRGYMPSEASASLTGITVLPYVNGCSTRQLLPPARQGDPTLQLLKIPPYSSEQANHIHTTVRVAYILEGKGRSIVGMEGKTVSYDLTPGTVCILDPMCPHHFETTYGESLKVVPLHVFSSTVLESSHPMYNGTHIIK